MSDKSEAKRKRKGKYRQQAVQSKRAREGFKEARYGKLGPGMTGFFVTCSDNREGLCVKEVYQLLDDCPEKPHKEDESSDPGEDDTDVGESLAKECASLRQTSRKPFFQVGTGVKNCLFVRWKEEVDPAQIVSRLMEEAMSSGKSKCRFIQRILPVHLTCKAFMENIKKTGEELISQHLDGRKDTEFSYSVQFKARHNTDVTKAEILTAIPDMMKALFPLCRVNLDSPDVTIHFEILAGVCCLSVVEDFFKYRKFNIQEVAAAASNKAPPTQ